MYYDSATPQPEDGSVKSNDKVPFQMHKELYTLFTGYTKSYVKLSLTGESDTNGKKQAKYITVHEPITAKVWKDHLDGKYRIGLRPEMGDECLWACIDLDPNDKGGEHE